MSAMAPRQQTIYSPNAGASSNKDPRGRLQNQEQYQQSRYESQQGPTVNAMAYNYGRGSEADYGNYTDIMNQYRNIASGGGSPTGGSSGSGGSGGSGDSYSAFTVSPGRASYNDPFKSYGGYEEFSKTGGYSPQDINNMRARSVAPIRAAYANAQNEIGRQRSLQGGYSPNAIAAQVKMAREQGQSGADALQNTEAGLAQMRNQGRLAGLGGMSGIEGQRLNADVDLGKFNTELDFRGQTYNADANSQAQARNIALGQSNADRSAASSAQNTADRLKALGGMTSLYGTTPGMSNEFGNQLTNMIGQGGTYGLNMMNNQRANQQLPGQYDQTMSRTKDIISTGSQLAYPFLEAYNNRQKQQNPSNYNPNNYSG